VQYDPAKK